MGGSATRRAAIAPLLDGDWPLTPLDTGLRNRLRYALANDPWRRVLLVIGAPAYQPAKTWSGYLVTVLLGAVRRRWRPRRQPPG
jgi:hypothetical protein